MSIASSRSLTSMMKYPPSCFGVSSCCLLGRPFESLDNYASEPKVCHKGIAPLVQLFSYGSDIVMEDGIATFNTPTVMHFAAALLISAVLITPWWSLVHLVALVPVDQSARRANLTSRCSGPRNAAFPR
jgi:hypothetical protein